LDHEAEGGEVGVFFHELHVPSSGPGHAEGGDVERQRAAFEEQAIGRELVDGVALGDSVPLLDALVEEGHDLRGGVDREVFPEHTGGEASAAFSEEERGHEGAAGDDDGVGFYAQLGGGAVFAIWVEGGGDAAGAAGDDIDVIDAGGGDEHRAFGEGGGDVAHVGRALGAGGATEAADALSVAIGGVAVEGFVVEAEVLGAAGDDAGDFAEVERVSGGHAEHGLDALVIRGKFFSGEIGGQV